MGAIHDEKTYGLKIRESANDGSDFSNPDADYRILFLGEDGALYTRDSAGTVAGLTGVGGSGSHDIVDSHIAKCSSALTMTGTAADVPGATLAVTPAVAEIWIVDAVFDFRWTTVSAGQVAIGIVDLDGVDQTPAAILLGTSLARATVTQVYRIAATAAAHTIKLQAYKTTAGGVCEAQTETQIRVLRYVA